MTYPHTLTDLAPTFTRERVSSSLQSIMSTSLLGALPGYYRGYLPGSHNVKDMTVDQTAPSLGRHIPGISLTAVQYCPVHGADERSVEASDESLFCLEEHLSLDPERKPCQNWHEYFDPHTGKLRKTLWPCSKYRLCSRCLSLRVQEITNRCERGLHTYGQLAISALSRREATNHLRRSGKEKPQYLKYPLPRGRVLLVEDALSHHSDAVVISSLDDLDDAIREAAYHDLRTIVRLTPKRKRMSGGLGQKVKEQDEDREGEDGGQGQESEDVTYKIRTVSLREPTYNLETEEGMAKHKGRQAKKRKALRVALFKTRFLDPQTPKEAAKAANRRADIYLAELVDLGIQATLSRQPVRLKGHLAYTWIENTWCALNDAERAPPPPDLRKTAARERQKTPVAA